MQKIILFAFLLAFAGLPGPVHNQPPEPSLAAMAGQMIMVGFRGTEVADDAPVVRALRSGQAGGVVLFSRDVYLGAPRNIASAPQVSALIATLREASSLPLLVAVDQEGGRVQRLSGKNGFRDWPSARMLGQDSAEATYASALHMGSVLARAGFNLNFAPVVDVHHDDSPAIGRYERAFHEDPRLVVAHARAFAKGMRDAGVIPTLKHFPGHGNAMGDTHSGFVDISGHWGREELVPYRVLFDEGYDGAIMSAHVTLREYGELPADLNPAVIDGLLRKEMGWSGVVVTDDLQMKAISSHYSLDECVLLAVAAGADVLVFGNNTTGFDAEIAQKAHAALMGHVEAGRIEPERLRLSWRRIRALMDGVS